jgi:hypothetical protein
MLKNMTGPSDSVQPAEAQQQADVRAGLFPADKHRLWLVTLFVFGLLARLYFAGRLFLDPDEALHYWVSVRGSLAAVYHATLSTAHPPLFIVFLYYWRALGHSELLLRLPGVIAGLAFCWIIYRWIARVANERIAQTALPLLLFTPSLIWLSAEVRQYWLLLLFIAIALYCFERAVAGQSVGWIAGFAIALDLALATHYSCLLFALIMGIYALIRLGSVRANRNLFLACALGQLSALIEVGIFFKTHITLLKRSGLPQEIADTWLRKSIFHSGKDHVVSFLLRNTVRFFCYFLGNEVVGVLGLAAFVIGIFLVFRNSARLESSGRGGPPDSRGDAGAPVTNLRLLLVLPFVIAALAALGGFYPYGGTRHDVFLAPFVILGISVALSYGGDRLWIRTAIVVLVLAVANVFPSPAGPFIKPKDQSKSLMTSAMAALRNNPPGTIVFTDYEGGLVLGYYLCDHEVVEPVPPYQPFSRSSCGQLTVVAEAPSGSTIGQDWKFRASDFAQKAREIETLYSLPREAPLLVFRAGWSVGSDVELLKSFENLGCTSPQYFGRNILLCRIKAQ